MRLLPCRLRRSAASALFGLSLLGLPASALCQQFGNFPPPPPSDQPIVAPQPQSGPSALEAAASRLEWVPQGISALARQASWHTDITFDRSLLALAGDFSGLDAPARQSLARLNGISVHSYRFGTPGAYDPQILQAVRDQYAALGWKHIATQAKPSEAGLSTGQTDFWIDTQGVNVVGGAILLASPSSVNLIVVSGDISTLDLLHLRGHFGIPRFSDDALGRPQ